MKSEKLVVASESRVKVLHLSQGIDNIVVEHVECDLFDRVSSVDWTSDGQVRHRPAQQRRLTCVRSNRFCPFQRRMGDL